MNITKQYAKSAVFAAGGTDLNTLYIVVPCYNEEEVLSISARVMGDYLASLIAGGEITEHSRVMFVDDGSRDKTWEIISGLCDENPIFAGVKLSKNRGHQNALMAGLVTANEKADATVSIDADLQDDVNAIGEMVKKYNAGAHIVCGVRSSRETDTFLKRTTAQGYYMLMNIFGAKLIYNHADFRLLSREALCRLCRYGTDDLFLRGLITKLGFKPEIVSYSRRAREAGESKYSVSKMLRLALRGIQCGRMQPAAEAQVGELYIEKVLM